MKRLLLLGALLAGGALFLQDASVGHGGTYRGPGDTVPPGGGGGGGGGGPSTPGPSGPSTPGPSGPSTPGPAAPGAPAGGGGPKTPVTGGGDTGPDLTVWQFWWGFNKDPYLNLKARIHDVGSLTGSDDWFLGHGEKTEAKNTLAPSPEQIRQRIVPALVKALENEKNNDIVTACMIALAKIGDAESEEGESQFQKLIEARLNDPNQEIRETAAVALGILANPSSIDLLRALLEHDEAALRQYGVDPAQVTNYRTRAFAAYGLGLIGNRTEDPEKRREIVGILQRTLESPEDHPTRDIRVACLISMGLVPIEPIASPPVPEGEEAPPLDPTRSREDQLRYLQRYFEDDGKHYLIRAHAPRAMAQLLEGAPDELRQSIAESLLPYVGKRAKGEKELRQSAALALGRIGTTGSGDVDAKVRQALIDAYGDADQQVKNFSVIALAQIGARPGEGDNSKGRDEIKKHFLKNLVRGKSGVKPWIGLAIGVMERARLDAGEAADTELLQALRAALAAEKSPSNIGAYAIGAGIAGDLEGSESILLDKLQSFSQDEARGDIAIALGLMGSRNAMEPIQEIVKKSKYRADLLKQAAIALGLLGDKEIVPELTTMLKNEGKSLATQAAIASALGFIGDQRSVDPLVEMLEDKSLTDRARAFAAVALGIVADKELLPWNSKIGVDINYRANTTTLTDPNGTGILDIL